MYMHELTEGSLRGVSCFHRADGMPGRHGMRFEETLNPFELDSYERAQRTRPLSLTDDCIMIAGGDWTVISSDIFCIDG
jgi:hypothetical protein